MTRLGLIIHAHVPAEIIRLGFREAFHRAGLCSATRTNQFQAPGAPLAARSRFLPRRRREISLPSLFPPVAYPPPRFEVYSRGGGMSALTPAARHFQESPRLAEPLIRALSAERLRFAAREKFPHFGRGDYFITREYRAVHS